MPDGLVDDVLNEIQEIALFVKDEIVEGALEVRDFAVAAVDYASTNISPAFLQLVTDCMAAAEVAFKDTAHSGMEKYNFAYSNAVAIAKQRGIEFIEKLFDHCVQYVISERDKRRALKVAASLGAVPA